METESVKIGVPFLDAVREIAAVERRTIRGQLEIFIADAVARRKVVDKKRRRV